MTTNPTQSECRRMIEQRLGAAAARILERLQRERPLYAKLDVLPEDGARAVTTYDERCVYCQTCGDAANAVGTDLLVPATRGGTNHPQNLVAACEACRRARRGRHLDVFLAERLELDARAVYARIRRATASLQV